MKIAGSGWLAGEEFFFGLPPTLGPEHGWCLSVVLLCLEDPFVWSMTDRPNRSSRAGSSPRSHHSNSTGPGHGTAPLSSHHGDRRYDPYAPPPTSASQSRLVQQQLAEAHRAAQAQHYQQQQRHHRRHAPPPTASGPHHDYNMAREQRKTPHWSVPNPLNQPQQQPQEGTRSQQVEVSRLQTGRASRCRLSTAHRIPTDSRQQSQ